MHRLALVIGVDRYIFIKPHLKCAASDARALGRYFREQLDFETEVLTDDELTKAG